MADRIQYFHGTQAAFDAASAKQDNALYFITDTERIYRGSNLVASNNAKVVQTMPEASAAIEGMLYIHTESDKTSIKIANTNKDGFIVLASSDANITANGIAEFTNKTIDADENTISNLVVSNFKEEAISTALPDYSSENVTTGVDTKLITEKAVGDALANTIINVDYTAPEGESGPVLVFTSKNGMQKTVNIPRDNFLSSANLNEEAKELELTMVTGDVIKIPVADLMVSQLDTDHIILSEDIKVMGSNWGSWTDGSTMATGTTLTNILKKGTATQVAPTYKAPSISIANNSGTASGNIEAGTTINVKLKSTFTQNDAGALTAHQFYKGSTAVGESSTVTPITYEESFVLGDSTVTYTSKATYGAGAVKNDNLGDPYPTGQIAAGTKTSSNYSFTGKRYGFYGSAASDMEVTSANIRNMTKTSLGIAAGGSFTISVPIGAKYVYFAYPASLRDVNQVMYVETNDTGMATSFTKTTVDVADARGTNGDGTLNGSTSYKFYKFEMAGAAQATMTFKVTI